MSPWWPLQRLKTIHPIFSACCVAFLPTAKFCSVPNVFVLTYTDGE